MKDKTLKIWENNDYNYDCNSDFIPTLTKFLHEDNKIRSAVIVVPGGGYEHVSPIEAEVIVKKFYDAGHNVFLLAYTVNSYGLGNPVLFQPLRDISKSVILLRQHAQEWNINPNTIALCGFSAGAHLCASLGVHWNKEYLQDIPGIEHFSNKPNALILSYPVITSGEFAHRGSFDSLIGKAPSEEMMEHMSLEKQVGNHTPPTFLWHTATDQSVPVENSLFFAQALKTNNIPFEMHIFPAGHHGLSTAQENDNQYVDRWNSPVLEQNDKFIRKEIERRKKEAPNSILGGIPLTSFSTAEEFKAIRISKARPISTFPRAAKWVGLALEWLEQILV